MGYLSSMVKKASRSAMTAKLRNAGKAITRQYAQLRYGLPQEGTPGAFLDALTAKSVGKHGTKAVHPAFAMERASQKASLKSTREALRNATHPHDIQWERTTLSRLKKGLAQWNKEKTSITEAFSSPQGLINATKNSATLAKDVPPHVVNALSGSKTWADANDIVGNLI
jgi:hypothetical protein